MKPANNLHARILFICGSLEPGRDGVGDYCRKLAGEFLRKGNQAAMVSLNDSHITVPVDEKQLDGLENIPVLRLPSIFRENEKLAMAAQWINEFNPEIISIQYVPFAFHQRGMPFGIGDYFKKLTGGRKVHLMFHEIWQGESSESTVKDKIVGFLQKRISMSFISAVKPAWITTTNDYYQNCFLKAGVETVKIPVFSNMPTGQLNKSDLLPFLPVEIGAHREKYLIGCFFGSLIYQPEMIAKLGLLSERVKTELKKELLITHIGKSKGVEQQFLTIAAQTGIKTFVIGIKPEQEIANYLVHMDIGLTNYPKILYEKSGSVAALLNNGCPTLFLREGFEKDGREIDEITELDEQSDLYVFYSQKKDFHQKYGIETAYNRYAGMLNK